MNSHIATATEGQSVVFGEINKNMISINTPANQTAENAEHTASHSQDMERLTEQLQQAITLFKI